MPAQVVFDSKDGATYTASNGAPVNEPYAAQRAGLHGPLLLQGAYPCALKLVDFLDLIKSRLSPY